MFQLRDPNWSIIPQVNQKMRILFLHRKYYQNWWWRLLEDRFALCGVDLISYPYHIEHNIKDLEKLHGAFHAIVEWDSGGHFHNRYIRDYINKIPLIFRAIDSHGKPDFHRDICVDFDMVYYAPKNYGHLFDLTQSEWMPLAVDTTRYRPDLTVEKEIDVCFIGRVGQNTLRADAIGKLREIEKKHNLKVVIGEAWHDQMIDILRASRLSFNFHAKDDLNYRFFESLACGTCLITDRQNNGQEDILEPGNGYVTYDRLDLSDLELKIEYWLRKENEPTRCLAQTFARNEMEMHHDWANRIYTIGDYIKKWWETHG